MDFYKIVLILHIIAGMTALAGGLTAALARKRKGLHTLAGNIFYYSMILSASGALIMCLVKFNPFLLGVGLFTLYMIVGGKLVMRKKDQLSASVWKRYTLFGGFTSALMLFMAIYFMFTGQWNLGIILLTFGILQIMFTRSDVVQDPTRDPKLRIRKHINKMGGGLIATITAFVVVNVNFLPMLVVWLGPTLIGSILIARAHRHWSSGRKIAVLWWAILINAGFSIPAQSQVYIEKQSSHRFAQLTLGMETQLIPAGGQALEMTEEFPAQFIPKIHIGGTHFWGHAEFYVSFPLGNLGEKQWSTDYSFQYSPGVETGIRLYPWHLEKGKIRPYAGIAMAFYDFKWSGTNGEGVLQSGYYGPVQTGLTFQWRKHLFNLGCQYGGPVKEPYYISRTQAGNYSISGLSLSLGWKWQLETTLSAEYMAEKGVDQFIAEKFRDKKVLSGFSLAIGPSSSFVLGNGRFNKDQPYLDQHIGMGVFAEWGVGYYFHPRDAHLNLAYRKHQSTQAAFGFEQTIERSSTTLEVYKFLFDYHGFVPFIGASVSCDHMHISELDHQDSYQWEDKAYRVHPGLSFGWDIRPNEVQTWILRTNLRYTPIRWHLSDGRSLTFDQFEFNFIQLVWYPERWFAMRNM